MKRYGMIVISLLAVVGFVTGVSGRIQRGQAMEVKFNKRDLPKQNVHIITSVDQGFEEAASSYFKNEPNKSFQSLKPFSVFIKNSGEKPIVAYALVWQLVKRNGQVLTNTSSYSEPGILMGNQMPSDPRFRHTQTIEAGAVRCLAWSGAIDAEMEGTLGSSSIGNQTLKEADSALVRAQLTNELADASDMTVSVDGVFFDDGTFVGPNNTGFFERIQAIVNAKTDLLKDLALASEQGNIDETLASIESKSREPDFTLTSTSSPEDHYKYYTKLFALEIIGMRSIYAKEQFVAHAVASHNRARLLVKK